jgi:ABC-type Fe3+-hydroxamate transport system substrate-binding protein
VDVEAIAGRAGWSNVTAVRAGRIYDIAGEDVLSPGPSIVHGLRRIHDIIQELRSA